MSSRFYRWQVAFAALYLAMLPAGSGLTFWRSLFFGIAAVLALGSVVASASARGERIPLPSRPVAATLAAWCCWNVASLAWSIHPQFTADELVAELAWPLLTMLIFYVAVRDAPSWRGLAATTLCAFSVLAIVALAAAAWPASGLERFYTGVGSYSTWAILVAPLMLLLLVPAPAGFAAGRWTTALALGMLVLLLASLRVTDNRIAWIALVLETASIVALVALRWPAPTLRASWRWIVPAASLLLVLGALFFDAAAHRAQTDFPAHTALAQTLVDDPRVRLWAHTIALIEARPLTGYGFGRAILENEFLAALGDPRLVHAHNLFVSRWLQTGLIGLGLFVALMLALAGRYLAFLRTRNRSLAVLGLLGLTMLVGFVVRNMTDDFLYRTSGREFWAFHAAMLGWGARLARERGA